MSDFGTKIGQLVTRKREDRGWSFAQTALVVYGDDGEGGEKRKGDIQRLEIGKSKKPNAATLKKLRDGLGITQAEIDACRGTPEELRLAHHADRLFDVIAAGARAAGLTDALTGELTERYAAGNPDDFDTALRGLERALQVAMEEAQKDTLPSNTDAAIDTILSRIDALNGEGQLDAAADLIAEEEARVEAGLVRLYDKGIAQAILTRDVEAAVSYELKKLRLDGHL